eukprot:8135287-Pyramimonas_sp.AAC.1
MLPRGIHDASQRNSFLKLAPGGGVGFQPSFQGGLLLGAHGGRLEFGLAFLDPLEGETSQMLVKLTL